MEHRRTILKGLLASLVAPLSFLRGSRATAAFTGGVDFASGPDQSRDFTDEELEKWLEVPAGSMAGFSPDQYHRLGDKVKPRRAWPVYNGESMRGGFTYLTGHPDCKYCRGQGTVIDSVGRYVAECVDFKLCPACQNILKQLGARCWRVAAEDAESIRVRFDSYESVFRYSSCEPPKSFAQILEEEVGDAFVEL